MKTHKITYPNGMSIFTDKDGLIHINIGEYQDSIGGRDGEEVEMCIQDIGEIIYDLKWLIKQVQ